MKAIISFFVFVLAASSFSCTHKNAFSSKGKEEEKIIWYYHESAANSRHSKDIPAEELTSYIAYSTAKISSIDLAIQKNIREKFIKKNYSENKTSVERKKNNGKDCKVSQVTTQRENDFPKKVPRSVRWSFILGFIAFYPYFFIPCGLAAVILGACGLAKIYKNPEIYRGKGKAITGIACGLFTLLVYSAIIYFLILYPNVYFK